MRRIFLPLVIFLSWLCWLPQLGWGTSDPVWVLRVTGTINPATHEYLKAGLEKAKQESARLVIMELDTPGGLVSSTRTIAQLIEDSSIPVVVYVTPAGASATSAGALIALASHVAAMAPGTNIGAAHPVGNQGKDIEGAMKEKMVNDVSAFARSLAELRGRNVKLAEQVVTKSKSFTAREAVSQGLVELIVHSRAELLTALNGRKLKLNEKEFSLQLNQPVVKTFEMTPAQKFLHLVANPTVAAILMSLGMLLLYVEISNPGITVAGVLGAVCLLVAFMSFQVLPVRTGGIALLGLGMAMMVAELFVTAKGALAIGGVVSFFLGLIWFLDTSKTDLRLNYQVLIPVGICFSGMIFVILYSVARTRFLARQALKRMGGGSMEGLSGYTGQVKTLNSGKKSGKVLIRGELWDFLSDTALQIGQNVRVSKTKGFRVWVEDSEQSAESDEETGER